MKPMDQQYIEKHDIAQRYLQGRLSPEEAQEFEVYLMDNPEMVESLEIDSLLNTSLQNMNVPSKHIKSSSFWKNKGFFPGMATASSFAMAFIVGWTMLYSGFNSIEINGDNQIVTLSTTRSNVQLEKLVKWNSKDTQLIVRYQPSNIDENVFKIEVRNKIKDRTIYEIQKVGLSSNGDIILSIPAGLLDFDTYELVVIGRTQNYTEKRTFRLVAKE